MDVDDPIPERVEKRLREQVHVTGQHDEVDAAELEPVGQLAISRGAIGVAVQIEDTGRNARLLGARERAGLSPVRRDRRVRSEAD